MTSSLRAACNALTCQDICLILPACKDALWRYLLKRATKWSLDAAWPNALITAHTQFQLSLDPTLDFEDFVDAAIKIVHRLQAARLPEGPSKRVNESPTPAEAANANLSKSMTTSLTMTRS